MYKFLNPICLFIIIFVSFALTGCKEKLTYSYLIDHPFYLQKQIPFCQSAEQKSPEQMADCEVVIKAAVNMQALVTEWQNDPEKFGQKIIDAESTLTKFKNHFLQARQELQQAQQMKSATLAISQKKYDEANKAYHEQRKKVKILLAVVGLASPE